MLLAHLATCRAVLGQKTKALQEAHQWQLLLQQQEKFGQQALRLLNLVEVLGLRELHQNLAAHQSSVSQAWDCLLQRWRLREHEECAQHWQQLLHLLPGQLSVKLMAVSQCMLSWQVALNLLD